MSRTFLDTKDLIWKRSSPFPPKVCGLGFKSSIYRCLEAFDLSRLEPPEGLVAHLASRSRTTFQNQRNRVQNILSQILSPYVLRFIFKVPTIREYGKANEAKLTVSAYLLRKQGFLMSIGSPTYISAARLSKAWLV